MGQLVAVALAGSPAFVDCLQRVWEAGDAVLPIDPRLPAAAVEQLLEVTAPSTVIDAQGDTHAREGGRPTEVGDALVVATSGSTGVPKGVVHTHASVAASAEASSARLGVDPDRDRWLCCLPVAHMGGLSVITRALHLGTGLEVHPGFDAAAVIDAAHRGATLTSVVPTALARFDPSLFRRIVVGGSAPPDPRPANVLASYGLTETGSAVVYDGWPFDGVELRIRDGEVLVRGPMLLRAYRDGTDPRDDEGWFATGDGGAIDEAGRLTVFGRRGDMIITGGENVWPEPVEAILARHRAVAEVAVVGRADDEWGQRVVAVVVPRDAQRPPRLEELRDDVRAELPAYCAPRSLELVTSLPRTPLGKLRRHQV